MIRIASEPGFFAREFLEMPLGALRASLLQALSERMEALTGLLNGLTATCFTVACRCQIDHAEVNAKGSIRNIGRWLRNMKGDCQEPRAFAIQEIGLSFDAIHTGLLIGSDAEGNQDPSVQRQERDGGKSFEGHHPLIIDDRTLWTKRRFDALITLVRITRFADGTNSQLSRQVVGRTQRTIRHFLQRKLVRNLRFKRLLRNSVAGSIKSVHGVKQGLMLVVSGSQLQEHRLFHGLSIARLREIVTSIPLRRRAIPPRHEWTGLPSPIFVKENGKLKLRDCFDK